MSGTDISWINLALGALVILIPLWIFYYFKTGLVKATIIAFIRMAIQLTLVGLYLRYIFEYNAVWLNVLWVFLMTFAASATVVKRSELRLKRFFAPVLAGVLTNVVINGAMAALIVVGGDRFFEARYIIPIMGIFIGGSINSVVIALRSFYNALSRDEGRYRYYLMSGATKNEALGKFLSEALKDAFSPVVASTATIGLIWLPGMMTGQILGGSSPITAIKYQILIVVGIFVGSVVTVFVSLNASKTVAFNEYDRFDRSSFAAKKT